MQNVEQVKKTIREKLVKKTKELDEAGFAQAVSLFDTHFKEREVETAFCWFVAGPSPACPPSINQGSTNVSPAVPIFPGNSPANLAMSCSTSPQTPIAPQPAQMPAVEAPQNPVTAALSGIGTTLGEAGTTIQDAVGGVIAAAQDGNPLAAAGLVVGGAAVIGGLAIASPVAGALGLAGVAGGAVVAATS